MDKTENTIRIILSSLREFFREENVYDEEDVSHDFGNWATVEGVLQHFKVKSYYTHLFRDLIESFNGKEFFESFNPKYYKYFNTEKDINTIFFTKDMKYSIKMIRKIEKKNFDNFYQKYFDYMNSNPDTKIAKILGLFKIDRQKTKSFYFIVMENILPKNYTISEIYDLKGSTYKRMSTNFNIKKDLDWIRNNKTIEKSVYEKVSKIIDRDTSFLQQNSLMDYSLLVISLKRDSLGADVLKIGALDGKGSANSNGLAKKFDDISLYEKGGIKLNEEPLSTVYFIGIIDIMTKYDFVKRSEDIFKTAICQKNKSCVNPSKYKQRLLDFLKVSVKEE